MQRLTRKEAVAYLLGMMLLGSAIVLILSGISLAGGLVIAFIGSITVMSMGFSYLKRLAAKKGGSQNSS